MATQATQAQKQAFEEAWENRQDNEPVIWQSLRYLLKLHDLDPKAVTVQLGHEIGEDFIRFIFDGVEFLDNSDDLTSLPDVFELNTRSIYNQTDAADFCKVSTRTLQRWTEKGLDHIPYKNQVLYDEDELVAFMDEIGHHPGMQRVGRHGHRAKK